MWLIIVEIVGVCCSINQCGKEYPNKFPVLSGSDDNEGGETGDPCLGRKLPDSYLFKTAVPLNYHLYSGVGTLVEYQVWSV